MNKTVANSIKLFLNVSLLFIEQKRSNHFIVLILNVLMHILKVLSFVIPLKMIFALNQPELFQSMRIFNISLESREDIILFYTIIIGIFIGLYFTLYICLYIFKKEVLGRFQYYDKKEKKILEQLYEKSIEGITGLILVTMITIVLIYIDVSLFLMDIFCMILSLLIVSYLYRNYSDKVVLYLDKILDILSVIIFFSVFYMILVSLDSDHNSLIVAVITLILVRKQLDSLKIFIMSVRFISIRKIQIQKLKGLK